MPFSSGVGSAFELEKLQCSPHGRHGRDSLDGLRRDFERTVVEAV